MILDYEDKMRIFKALSDQNRLEIIEILSCNEKCACEILKILILLSQHYHTI